MQTQIFTKEQADTTMATLSAMWAALLPARRVELLASIDDAIDFIEAAKQAAPDTISLDEFRDAQTDPRSCPRCKKPMTEIVPGWSFICKPCDLVEIDGAVEGFMTATDYLAFHKGECYRAPMPRPHSVRTGHAKTASAGSAKDD